MTWCLEKHLKNISIDVKCVSKDGGQGRGNMKKSSFAFKKNDIKGSGFHVYFLLFDFAIFDFIVSFDENRFSQTFLQDIKCQGLQQLDTEVATDVITSQSL